MNLFMIAYLEGPEFEALIKTVVEEKGVEYYLVHQGDQLSQLAKTYNPFLMLLDLCSPESGWLFKHITEVKSLKPRLPIVVIYNPMDSAIQMRAQSYGCDFLISRHDFIEQFPLIVESTLKQPS